jgi:hypothetical protein
MIERFPEIIVRHVAAQQGHILVRGIGHGVGHEADRVIKRFGWLLEPDHPARNRFRFGVERDRFHCPSCF